MYSPRIMPMGTLVSEAAWQDGSMKGRASLTRTRSPWLFLSLPPPLTNLPGVSLHKPEICEESRATYRVVMITSEPKKSRTVVNALSSIPLMTLSLVYILPSCALK